MSKWLMRRLAAMLPALPLFAATAHGAAITISSDNVQRPHQEEATLCASLIVRGNEEIAGTENELVWDPDCATLLDSSCAESPGQSKKLSGALQNNRAGTYKALMLSLSDTEPMSAGQLYCCNFLVHADPGSCCRVRITGAGGSDPDGNSVPVEPGSPGQLCVASDGSGGSSGGFGGGLGSGGLGGGDTGNIGGGDTGQLGGGTGNLGGGGTGGSGGGVANGGNTVVSGGGAQDLTDDAEEADDGTGAEGGVEDAGGGAPDGAPAGNQPQQAANQGGMPAQGGLPGQGTVGQVPNAPRDPATAPRPAAGAQGQLPAAAPAVAATPKADALAPTAAATPPGESTAAPTAGAVEPTGAPAADEGGEDAVEAEKPSPRDVAPAAGQGNAARPRRMPLDEDEGWFGCQTTGAGPSAWPAAVSLLLLLLARRRRRI